MWLIRRAADWPHLRHSPIPDRAFPVRYLPANATLSVNSLLLYTNFGDKVFMLVEVKCCHTAFVGGLYFSLTYHPSFEATVVGNFRVSVVLNYPCLTKPPHEEAAIAGSHYRGNFR